ncbi:MAG: LysM peptidoglycan-binding domain-containing protein [Anaerolineae bacterium]|nr:LysM peptidoglycan-binding domain-containing protein [Anaerolineae bacterium]HQY25094.1 CAP domain-containing protein [Thermoflexales bacterium]
MTQIRWPYVGAAAMVLIGCAVALLSLPNLSVPEAASAPATARPSPTQPPIVAVPVTPSATLPPTAAPSPTPVATVTPRPAPQASYVVQPGDTLLGIAIRFDVAMARIQIENDLGESLIVRGGQTLAIPAKAQPDERPFWRVRAVKTGETLSSIADEAGVTVADLVRVNGLGDSTVIRVGALLILPVAGVAALPPAAPTATALAVPTKAPTPIQPRAPVPTATAAVRSLALPAPVAAPTSGNAEQQLLAYYNEARAAAGVAPLRISPALTAAAMAHAQDCATRGSGSHVGSDGADTKTRVLRAGYSSPRAWGENWAWARSAAQAWDMWFTQEYPKGPHRDNILSARYTEVGFGIIAANGGFYYIADFGAR